MRDPLSRKPSPCKDCEDRQLYCHSTCKKYAEYKSSNEEVKKKIQKERDLFPTK